MALLVAWRSPKRKRKREGKCRGWGAVPFSHFLTWYCSLSINVRPLTVGNLHRTIHQIIYLGFEKSQRSVTHDSLRYINILTYLRTYLPTPSLSCICAAVYVAIPGHVNGRFRVRSVLQVRSRLSIYYTAQHQRRRWLVNIHILGLIINKSCHVMSWRMSPLSECSRSTCFVSQLVAWHSGWTSVFGRQTFPLLRSTCTWRVTSYMGKSSAAGQLTRPTRPFTLSGSINSKLQSDVRFGGAIWRMPTGWRPAVVIGAVVCSLAAAAGPTVRQRVQWTAALALQHHSLLPINCHFWWL